MISSLLILLLGSTKLSATEATVQIFEEIIQEDFEELRDYKIEFYEFKGAEYYFFTDISSAYKNPQNRTYKIYINEKIKEADLSKEAIRAIASHELLHILDYTKMNLIDLGFLFIKYEVFKSESFITKFERESDIRVIKKGHAQGLIEYREWLYKQLTKDQLVRKKRRYLRPEEIRSY